MTGPLLREATASDLDTVAEIYAHYVERSVATFDTVPPSVEHWAERLDALTAAGLPFLVAEDAGVVVGFAYLSAFRPKPAYRHTLEDTLYLAPDATGRGTGRLLLSALIAAAQETDAHQLIAMIATGEQGASVRLHRALGFEITGRLREVGYKFDRWVDVVTMQRPVGPASG